MSKWSNGIAFGITEVTILTSKLTPFLFLTSTAVDSTVQLRTAISRRCDVSKYFKIRIIFVVVMQKFQRIISRFDAY